MIHPRVPQHIQQRTGRAGFNIFRAVDQAGNAAVNHGAGAHDARLQRDIERGIQQAIVIQHFAALAQRHDLRVCGGIALANWPVPALAYDFISLHQHGSDRHLTLLPGTLRQLQRITHPVFISLWLHRVTPAESKGGAL